MSTLCACYASGLFFMLVSLVWGFFTQSSNASKFVPSVQWTHFFICPLTKTVLYLYDKDREIFKFCYGTDELFQGLF